MKIIMIVAVAVVTVSAFELKPIPNTKPLTVDGQVYRNGQWVEVK